MSDTKVGLPKICLDPGHGMGNRHRGVYDPGTCLGTYSEAAIAMDYANELRTILMARGHEVVRTRRNEKDPAAVSQRDDIATAYGCDIMISIHCNSGGGKGGTETFYRGAEDKAYATKLNDAVAKAFGTINRGVKTEKESQHTSLAVMEFRNCWLIELGFLDNAGDRAKMLTPELRHKVCLAIADVLATRP